MANVKYTGDAVVPKQEDSDFLSKAKELVAKRKQEEALAAVESGPKVTEGNQVFKGDVIIKGDVITKGNLIIFSQDGKSSVKVSANENMAGIWIQSESKDDKYPRSYIAISDSEAGPVIGFYRDMAEAGFTFAIAIGTDGSPQVQVPNGVGGFGTVGLAELLDIIKKGWRAG